ncbi:MAG: glycosyltransferase [Rhodospirillales bacterium]
MRRRRAQHRLLIYSHDSFGLGHLRRCRTIAHALVADRPNLQVLILTGSPIIGSFSFCNRVDFVRIPGVIKLRDGDYMPLSLDIGLRDLIAIRGKIIRHTAEAFAPDLFLVDKEPLGLRGEVKDTLAMLKCQGVPLILGLRDVLDEPAQLAEEWQRKNVGPALTDLYDHIWVYGLPSICNALEGIDLPAKSRDKVHYTGYLRRTVGAGLRCGSPALDGRPYILVTTGGGGDGAELIDWVLSAYESDPTIPLTALLVLGPFMHSARQAEFMARVGRLPRVEAITFDANLEALLADAAGVVAMGGYNTFCEILSFDKPAIIVPRREPRLEQLIRSERAEALGLVRMLIPGADGDPAPMAAALHALPAQPRPSAVAIPGLLDGLEVIRDAVDDLLARDDCRDAAWAL